MGYAIRQAAIPSGDIRRALNWAISNKIPVSGEDIHTTVDHVSVIGKKFQIVVFRDLDDELIVEILSAFSEIT